jgi:hypothetical protein
MLSDRFAPLLADAVFEYVLALKTPNESCGALSEIPVLRSSVVWPDTRSDAYRQDPTA